MGYYQYFKDLLETCKRCLREALEGAHGPDICLLLMLILMSFVISCTIALTTSMSAGTLQTIL